MNMVPNIIIKVNIKKLWTRIVYKNYERKKNYGREIEELTNFT